MRLAFDIETDGLLRGLTKIHCIAAQDLDNDTSTSGTPPRTTSNKGLAFLLTADELWGHNIVGYDYQAIREIYPKWVYRGRPMTLSSSPVSSSQTFWIVTSDPVQPTCPATSMDVIQS